MLPFVNPFLSDALFWTRDILAQYLGIANTAAGKKNSKDYGKKHHIFRPLSGWKIL
jgi:hypothetical protein